MLTADMTHAKTLQQFYEELKRGQEQAHDDKYCKVHQAITYYLSQCETYKELGVKQGTTAAAAVLAHPASVHLIDHKLGEFEPYRHLFEEYCGENNIRFKAEQMSSLTPRSVSQADVLFIDTWHVPNQLKTELAIHHKFTNNYIIMHDTEHKPALYDVIVEFIKSNPWKIIEHNRESVGYTVLERVK